MSAQLKLLLLALASFAVGALAVSGQSLWIDEGAAAMKAVQPTLGAWWAALREEGHSNLQLLPHLFLLWGWEKAFGHSEIALRALNVPLLFLGLAAAHWGLRTRPRLQFWFPLLVLVNAFTWYYTNEARPYILLFAVSCIPLACLLRAFDRPEECRASAGWLALLYGGVFLVAATSLIAVPWALAWLVAAALALGWRPMFCLARRHMLFTACFMIAMAALGGYYLWTLSLGAGPSQISTTNLETLLFVLYEQSGLAGLGPGRIELRAGGVELLRDYRAPLLIAAVVFLPLVWQVARVLRSVFADKRALPLVMIAVALPLAAVVCAGVVLHVRILGRHLATFYPVLIFAMAAGMAGLVQRRGVLRIAAAGAIVAVLLFSALQIRFSPRHFRDDYRSAAAVARAAIEQQRVVWWAGDHDTGVYYRVPFATREETGAIHLLAPVAGTLENLPPADLIVLSKPDVYDLNKGIAAYMEQHRFTRTAAFQSFEIFERTPPP